MKLLNYYIENFEPVKKGKDLYGLSRDCFQHLFTDKGYYFVKIQKEVLWNGASVPFLLRWFLPNWDKKDNRYNALSLLHDVAFATNRFELFIDFMHRIQARSPFVQTFIVQLTADPRGRGSYLATERAQKNKGYSATPYCNQVSPKGGQQLVEQTLKMLDEAKK